MTDDPEDEDEDKACGFGAAWGAVHGVAETAPLPTRFGFACARVGKELGEEAGETAAVPQEVSRAVVEREERAVEDLSFKTRPAEEAAGADCEDAPAMGG